VLFLHEFYGSSCEEMESDAVAQICQTYAVSFLSIRVISNTVFDGDTDWDLTVGPALQNYVLAVIAAHVG
jgi:adenosylhomocysteine nucleosidase